VLSGLIFASAPAWLTVRRSLSGVMREGTGPIVASRRSDRLLTAFLVTDVAFVSILLVATTLVVTSFVAIVTADLGFDRQNVVRFEFLRSLKGVPADAQPAAVAAFRANLLQRAASVPGVTDVAISTSGTPLSGTRGGRRLVIPGFGDVPDEQMPLSFSVTAGYFRAFGMLLVRGRLFAATDRAGTPRVMVINDVAARLYFAGRDPVGQTVADRYPRTGELPFTVVGVLKGIHFNGPEAEVRPEVYALLDQETFDEPYIPDVGARVAVGGLVVRTVRDPRALAATIAEAIRPALGGDPNQTTFIDNDFRRLTAVRRFNAGVMGIFGLVAIALGAVGIYGTVSFVVAQQVRSIGLRMALGETPARVLRSVLRKTLRHLALGVAIGLTCAWLGSGVLTSFVFGIQPSDPTVYLAVGAFLGTVGLAAALAPALRASRLDPLVALRQE
jgi:predicted permease